MRVLKFFVASLCLLAFLPIAASVSAQQEESAPVFRVGGLSVVIDAVVMDKRNRFVPNLTADDFVVYENDQPQSLDGVVFFRPDSNAMAADAVGGQPTQAVAAADAVTMPSFLPEQAIEPRRNLIVFLLDYATTEYINQNLVQEAAIKYVNENLTENDYVAVFGLGAGFGLLQTFTNDKQLLIEALQLREMSGRTMASLPDKGPDVQADAQEAVNEAGMATVSAGSPQQMAAAGQETSSERSELARLALAVRIQKAFYNMGSFVQEREARGVLTAIRAIAQGLESIEGRKTLILFSQGFVLGPHVERALERTISAANRANLAVYSIDSQGLMNKDSLPGSELYSIGATQGYGNAISGYRIDAQGGLSLFDRAKQVGSDVRDSALRYVSVSTGGFAIRNTNDLHIGMERIDQDMRSYYLLTYRPSNQDFDGTFRNVRVEVKNPDYSVRHRSGYQALPPGSEVLSVEDYRTLRSAERGEIALDLPAFLRLETFQRQAEEDEVLVNLEVAGEGVKFEREEVEQHVSYRTDIEVIGVIRDSEGSGVLRFGTPMTFRFSEPELRVLKTGGLSFNNKVELAPGVYTVQVLVRDNNSQRSALMEQTLRIVEPSPELQLSTIVLGKEVQKAGSNEQLLSIDDTTILPSAGRRFHNGENLLFYFEVYNAGVRGEKGEVRAQVALQRTGSRKALELPAITVQRQLNGNALAVSRFVELQGLAPGRYLLEARVTDQIGGNSTVGRTAFTLVD